MANQEVKRLFFVCDGWDERDGDDRLFYMLLRYHLRGFPCPPDLDSAVWSAILIALNDYGGPICTNKVFVPDHVKP